MGMNNLHADLTDMIIRYEQDEMDETETVDLFQQLIDSGMAWSLQGHYGKTAMELIRNGQCIMPPQAS